MAVKCFFFNYHIVLKHLSNFLFILVVEPLAVLGISYLSYLAAELFHFSGIISIIGCGVVQAHYALKNISDHSRTTVTYFTKMIR